MVLLQVVGLELELVEVEPLQGQLGQLRLELIEIVPDPLV
jgi:hypothetical protein